MSSSGNTPILIGVGEASERIDAADYAALSPVALAAKAAAAALEDAGAPNLAGQIDVIAADPPVRSLRTRRPGAVRASNNFSRSVGGRIGADPRRAILEVVGGQGPQHLVNEFAHAIAAGEAQMVLLVGSEASPPSAICSRKGETRDWAERSTANSRTAASAMRWPDHPRPRRPRRAHADPDLCPVRERASGATGARSRRLRLNGRLFAPFTKVAAGNPHAMSPEVYSADDLATVTGSNRLTSDPFPRRMVARDQANQGAAVLMTSVGKPARSACRRTAGSTSMAEPT